MFPSDIDLNDLAVASMETSTVKATIGATTLGRSPYFDWRKRRFIFNSGFNRECTLTESIQQHIRLFINTVKTNMQFTTDILGSTPTDWLAIDCRAQSLLQRSNDKYLMTC